MEAALQAWSGAGMAGGISRLRPASRRDLSRKGPGRPATFTSAAIPVGRGRPLDDRGVSCAANSISPRRFRGGKSGLHNGSMRIVLQCALNINCVYNTVRPGPAPPFSTSITCQLHESTWKCKGRSYLPLHWYFCAFGGVYQRRVLCFVNTRLVGRR